MVEHRKTKLEQQYWLYQLNKEVEELEKWITEREAVASSTELGQDLGDVTVSPSMDKYTDILYVPNSEYLRPLPLVLCIICVSGASGEVHQLCIRNQQHWSAAHGAGEQNGE